MAASPTFRLFGFPVHVRPGFLLLLVLIVAVNGTSLGLWLALFLGAFTLMHELGHALAARATGARSEIALDFLYGYASFLPTRPLKHWERAGISVAGPAVQIVLGIVGLWITGVNAFGSKAGWTDVQLALWFAGPLLGLLNLVPVLPLDGGNIAEAGLEAVVPERTARTVMIYVSLAITGTAAVLMLLSPRWRTFGIFAIVPLIGQLQMLSQLRAGTRPRQPRPVDTASLFAGGEATAWRDGRLDKFVDGQLPSPWYRAHQQLTMGHPDVARQVLLADFADPTTPDWWPPDAAPEMALDDLVRLLGDPLPTGRTYSEFVLASVLLRLGDYERAANYAAEAYRRERSPMLAVCVSRAAAALGDRSVALGWLRAAIGEGPPSQGLRHAADNAPEFDDLRKDHEFQALTH